MNGVREEVGIWIGDTEELTALPQLPIRLAGPERTLLLDSFVRSLPRRTSGSRRAWGSGKLFAASIHVAMSAPNCHILEVSQGYMPMMYELFNEPFDVRPDGTVHAPTPPGLAFTLRADALDRLKYV